MTSTPEGVAGRRGKDPIVGRHVHGDGVPDVDVGEVVVRVVLRVEILDDHGDVEDPGQLFQGILHATVSPAAGEEEQELQGDGGCDLERRRASQ